MERLARRSENMRRLRPYGRSTGTAAGLEAEVAGDEGTLVVNSYGALRDSQESARGSGSEGNSMTTSSGTSDEKSREVRLGLVLYGGGLLEIFINWGAHEGFCAAKGQGNSKII